MRLGIERLRRIMDDERRGILIDGPAERIAEAAYKQGARDMRERCAKVCDESEIPFDISVWINSTKRQMTGNVAHALADMIRALKDGEE